MNVLRAHGSKILVAAIAAAFLLVSRPVSADHQELFCGYQTRTGCLDVLNPAILELRSSGAHRWSYHQEGNSNLLEAITTGLNEYAARYSFDLVYDPSSPYRQIATGGLAFIYGTALHGPCGTWAIECLPDFPSKPHVVYNADTMVLWGLRSQIEVVLHGVGHQIGNFAEQYREAYIYGDTTCTNKPRIMDCGLFNAQFLGAFEDGSWAKSHNPGRVTVAGEVRYHPDGTPFIFFCGSNTAMPGTRVALMAVAPWGEAFWSGNHYASNAGCTGQVLRSDSGWCFYWNVETEYSWRSPLTRNDTLAGCMP